MSESAPIVFIVDDDQSVGRSLSRVLRSAGFASETFPSAEAYLARVPFEGLGCLILDLCMPGLTGLDLQKQLTATGTVLPVIFLSGHGDIPSSVQAMAQGAVTFLTKPVHDDCLLAAVRKAFSICEQDLTARRAGESIRTRLAKLTPREFEVLRAVIAGKLNKQIAARLGIVEKTVKVHRGQVMQKMGVASVAELVRDCAQVGVEPDAAE
jgi:FixJ family two-component response regulator